MGVEKRSRLADFGQERTVGLANSVSQSGKPGSVRRGQARSLMALWNGKSGSTRARMIAALIKSADF